MREKARDIGMKITKKSWYLIFLVRYPDICRPPISRLSLRWNSLKRFSSASLHLLSSFPQPSSYPYLPICTRLERQMLLLESSFLQIESIRTKIFDCNSRLDIHVNEHKSLCRKITITTLYYPRYKRISAFYSHR